MDSFVAKVLGNSLPGDVSHRIIAQRRLVQLESPEVRAEEYGAAGDNGDHASELRHAYVASFGAIYANGPFDLGLAYEHNYSIRTTGRQDDALSVAAAYDFGAVGPPYPWLTEFENVAYAADLDADELRRFLRAEVERRRAPRTTRVRH